MSLILDKEMEQWYYHYVATYKIADRCGPEAKDAVKAVLAESANPFSLPIRLISVNIRHCKSKEGKHTTSPFVKLVKFFIKTTLEWVKEHLTEDQQMALLTVDDGVYIKAAFEVSYAKPLSELFRLLADCYQFAKFGHLVEDRVRQYAEQQGDYLGAFHLVAALNLTGYYYIDNVIFPAMCQGEVVQLARAYFERNPAHVAALVDLLQSVAVPYRAKMICQKLVEDRGYKNLPEGNFTCEWFQGLLKRIAKWECGQVATNLTQQFNITGEVIRRCSGSLTRQIFMDRMTHSIDKTDVFAQTTLISQLLERNLLDDAKALIEYYQLDMGAVPLVATGGGAGGPRISMDPETHLKQAKNHYKLNLRQVNYARVYTDAKFREMLVYLREQSGPTAIAMRRMLAKDRPVFCLLQIAKGKNIYVVDLIAGHFAQECWQELAHYLRQADILGNRMTEQILEMAQFRELEEPLQRPLNILNVVVFAEFLSADKRFRGVIGGLSAGQPRTEHIVSELFRKSVPPHGKFSVWSKRPLPPESIYYAALVTYALLDIVEALNTRLLRCKFDPAAVVREFHESRPNDSAVQVVGL